MSENTNKEISGISRDPVTAKRALWPEIPLDLSLKKIRTENNVNNKTTNIVRYLNAREMRAIGVQETREYKKMRWNSKQHIQTSKIRELANSFGCTNVDVDYILGTKYSVYGLWTNEKLQIYVVGTERLKERSTRSSYFHKVLSPVIDVCAGFDNDFLVVYGPTYSHSLLVERFDKHSGLTMIQWKLPFGFKNSEEFNKQIFCCRRNKNYVFYAFGSENFVFCIDSDFRKSFHNINGKIHTLSFGHSGNLMLAGVDTGRLFLYDFRMNKLVMRIHVSTSCLLDSAFVPPYHAIVAGQDDVLCKIDLRKVEVVTEYLTYKKEDTKKAPFSIGNDMLCASGTDNTIKIWDLSGGLPLHVIRPDNPGNKIKGWLRKNDHKTNLYCFEGMNKKVFEIV